MLFDDLRNQCQINCINKNFIINKANKLIIFIK